VITEIVKSTFTNRYLIGQLAKREIIGRYRGTSLGLAWSLINPLLMLGVYTFVFGIVFQARWGVTSSDSKLEFALVLFAGLIINNLFAECVNRAPMLVVLNANYVKKIVFPLEILPIVSACSALFHAAISTLVLVLAQLILKQSLPWTIILIPLLIAPLVIATTGLCWLLASLGVYLRDIVHLTALATTVLLFMSPVFYPISALPHQLQPWLHANPLTFFLEAGRGLLIFGQLPDPIVWACYWALSFVAAWLGFWWFQRTRKGFADVL
jgi:lipopolysaccharide transport system permease protein